MADEKYRLVVDFCHVDFRDRIIIDSQEIPERTFVEVQGILWERYNVDDEGFVEMRADSVFSRRLDVYTDEEEEESEQT